MAGNQRGQPAVSNRVIAVAGLVLIGIFLLLAIISSYSSPARADRLISVSLASLSLGVALIAFGFLRGQTANIQYQALGLVINVGGALAAGMLLFGTLQFGIRGTSNLLIELYADSQFRQLWRAPPGSAPPEFAASLESYTVVAKPDDFIVRFHNLPIFERVFFHSRDSGWNIAELKTSDTWCVAKGASLSGWCTRAQAVVTTNNCLDQWTGSGNVRGRTLDQVIDYFVEEMKQAKYPAKRLSAVSKDALHALNLDIPIPMSGYSRQDFCTAINPYKVALEQKLRKPIKIALSCDTIGIAVSDEKMPMAPTGQGWRSPC